MKSISLNQRRFLIIWCFFHLFALATNLIPIKGEITSEGYNNYIFTYGESGSYYDGGFWPFVKMNDEKGYDTYDHQTNERKYRSIFLGIFHKYNTGAFIVYIVLGFAIVFLPKLWGKNEG